MIPAKGIGIKNLANLDLDLDDINFSFMATGINSYGAKTLGY
jgi:hypothetical protein